MFKSIEHILSIILIIVMIVLSILLFRQCSKINKQDDDINRLNNNLKAQVDTIQNYKDKYGNSLAEIRSYQMETKELDDSVKQLLKKNQSLESYISTSMGMHDTIIIDTRIDHDTVLISGLLDKGQISFSDDTVFGKSSRSISGVMCYSIDTVYTLRTDGVQINLDQDIYVEAAIVSDKKTNETFVELKTDYPGTVFNSGQGILVTDTNIKQKKKNLGVGLGVHLGFGAQYGLFSKSFDVGPYIGVGIQFSYTPKAFQW